jgi:hypothetical protein
MRTVRNIAARMGVAGAIAAVSVIPASAFEVYVGPRHHHHYYDYYGGGNGCRPGWTVQGGVCKPYRYGPWDIYGGGRATGDINNMEVASAAFSFAPAASRYLSRSVAPRPLVQALRNNVRDHIKCPRSARLESLWS